MPLTECCPELFRFQQLLLGRVRSDEAEQLERHLAECPECSAKLEEVEPDDSLLQTMRERSAILAGADTPLTARVIEQVRSWPQTWVPTSVAEPTVALDFLDPPLAPDELGRLAPYRVLRTLGRGGMGVVLLAEDTRLRRLVALKVILDARYADPRSLTRFEQEGAALARLRHPNVVQIYEVGQQRGRPYLALEYVAGGSLAQLPSGQPHSVRNCAEFIATLARAVQHAHDQGVIHRDLKPGNILLQKCTAEGAEGAERRKEKEEKEERRERTARPESRDEKEERRETLLRTSGLLSAPSALSAVNCVPKVADFGLARRLDEDGQTQTGDLLGTPGYMAPELTRGQAKDSGVAVDVYSLGAILYELLTGRPPFRGETVLDTLEQARTLEPVPPRRLRPGLPRDVETITLKCLAKDPHRRYGSAAKLADDLDRFQQGRPIHARPTGPAERVFKWTRRRPLLAALLVLLGLSVAAMVGGALVYEQRLRTALTDARTERTRADANYREARDALQRMLERAVKRGGDGIPKLQELRREQQEDALAFFLKMAEQQSNDPEVRFEAARAHHEAGMLQHKLGRSEEAARNFERAEPLLAALAAEFPREPLYRYHRIEALKLIAATKEQAPAATEAGFRQALAASEELVSEGAESISHRSQQADILITLGSFLNGQQNKREAEKPTRRAVAIYEALTAEDPQEVRHRRTLARAYGNLSSLLHSLGQSSKEFHDKAEVILEKLCREHPDDDALDGLAVLRINWAYALLQNQKTEVALADLAKNVTMLNEALQREPNHTIFRDRLYRTHGVRGTVFESQKRFAEAAEECRRVVALSASPAQADFHRLFLAMALVRAGNHESGMKELGDWASRTTAATRSDQLHFAAQVCGVALEGLGRDQSVTAPVREERARDCTARAIAFLRQSRKAAGEEGWKKTAVGLPQDELLRPFWNNAEFKQLTDTD